MKTLVNKNNPAIRITAPEIEICDRNCIGYYYVSSVGYCVKDRWTLVEEGPTCKESLQVEEEHPDNFTSFEWLIGRLMFRGCDLWGMTDGEDDNGVVTKLIKDRAAEMVELLERELDPNAEPVDLEKEIDRLWDDFSDEISGPHNKFDIYARVAHHFYELGRKGGII